MIKVEHLSKRFGDNVVLDDISFEIADGEVVSVIGPSGTGKSTLLRCINRLETPDAGSVSLDGKAVAAAQKKTSELEFLRQNTGMVFQKFNLFEKKTALENVMEGLVIVKKMPKEEARAHAQQELERVGMSAWANHYPRHLSGGQQQRVAIARAIAMKPKLLLLDEPTSALDPELVGEVLDVIKQLANDGFTMLLVSHEINFVKKVSDKIIFIEKGHIVEQGTPRQVFDNPQNERTREFLFKMNLLNEPEYTI